MSRESDKEPIKLTVLGSGTSMGVPSLGCHCRVCSSLDARDNRFRPSLLLSRAGQNVVIDTTPDFENVVGQDRIDRRAPRSDLAGGAAAGNQDPA